MRLSPFLALIGLVVVGCTSTPPPRLEPCPGIGEQIIDYSAVSPLATIFSATPRKYRHSAT